ncbi:MAG: 3-dehydroquinate synthase, partial [Gemmatimonadetes bacterium]|nr:3-dehydroquinate synthase [Gemmatimonadota bacterium]
MGVRALLPEAVARSAPSGRCALINDENVDRLWGREVARSLAAEGIDVVAAAFPAGETHKTRETWAALTDVLMEAGLGRDSCVVSLG